jgi:hypothetical protein
MSLDDLIERLALTMQPSIELDEAIREAVGADSVDHGDGCEGPPEYTRSMDAAMTLLRGLTMPEFEVQFAYRGMGNWMATARAGDLRLSQPTEHFWPALALSLAALKAHRTKKGRGW